MATIPADYTLTDMKYWNVHVTYRWNVSIFEALLQQLSLQLTFLKLSITDWICLPTQTSNNNHNNTGLFGVAAYKLD